MRALDARRHLVRRVAGGAALGVELIAIGVAAEEVSVREAGERGGAGRGHRDDEIALSDA